MVSIILPVYNTGDILKLTLESIVEQSYKDWELILIDDGSTDISKDICDNYSQKDGRIKVFHKKNGGICDARNFGLSHVTGDYVAFCDHDDLYDNELLDNVVKSFQDSDCDIVCYRYSIKPDNKPTKLSTDLSQKFGKYPINIKNITSSLCALYDTCVLETVWSMVYKTSFLKEAGVLFDNSFKFGGEDINFNLRLLAKKPSFLFINDVLYTHFVRGNLSTSAKFHPENDRLMLRHIIDFNEVASGLNIDLNSQYSDYNRLYVRLLRNSLSFVVRCGCSKQAFENHCLCFANEYKLGDIIRGDVLFNSRFERLIVSLFNARQFTILFHIFKMSWRLK